MHGEAHRTVSDHDRRGRFVTGNQARDSRKARIAKRLQQLMDAYDTSPAYVQVLSVIAGHLDAAEHARGLQQRVLASNSARRLLAGIPRKTKPRSSLQELMAAAHD